MVDKEDRGFPSSKNRWDGFAWFGMTIPFTLIAQLFVQPTNASALQSFWASPYSTFILTCLATCMIKEMRIDSLACRLADAAAHIAMAVAVLLIYVGGKYESTGLLLGAMGVGGVGIAWAYVRWGVVFSALEIRQSIGVICLSVAMAGALKLVIEMVPPLVGIGVELALAIEGFLALRRCLPVVKGLVGRASSSRGSSLSLRDLWVFLAALVILCGTLGALYNVSHPADGGVFSIAGFAMESLCALGVFWWVCPQRHALNVVGISASLAVVVATGTFALAVLGERAGTAFALCTNVDHSLLTLFLWIILTDLTRQLPMSSHRVFAIGWVVRSTPFWLVGRITALCGLELTPSFCNFVSYLIVITLALVLAGNSLSVRRLLSDLRGRAQGGAKYIEQRCARLAMAYSLTQRETEVMGLLAQGYSRPHIAETLDLSENTVRGYTKALYKKLDIHDRQSLYALVDGRTPAPGGDG